MLETVSRFTRTLGRLRTAVGAFVAHQARGPRVVALGDRTYVEQTAPTAHRTIAPETWLLLMGRIERLSNRVRRLVDRWQAGLVPIHPLASNPAAAPRAVAQSLPAPSPGKSRPYHRLPREHGWINRRIP